MAKLTRQTARVFGENATPHPTNNDPEIGQFGSAKAGYYTGTGDIATIQGLDNGSYWAKGWINAVTPNQQFPALPEMTGVHKVLSYQNAYVLQEGIPEYDAGTTYYQNSICKGINAGGYLTLYKSLTNNNTGNALTNTTYWKAIPIEASGYANTELSNLTTEGNDRLHALKGYEDKGELLTDTEGLADVTYYAHSTFDGSKFTGSLTVPNTGIASGFNSSDDLLTDYVFNPQGTWEIRGSFVTPSIGATETIITTTATYGTKIRIYDNYKIGFMASSNNSSYDIAPAGFAGANALLASTKYYFKFEFTGTQYILSTSTDNITWTEQCKKDNTNRIYTTSSTSIRIGKAGTQYEIFTGSVNLKDFYIVENGVITFRGNQTGIDTIKPDNYTPVQPSPHDPIPITPEGVASGFSATKYVSCGSITTSSNDFEVKCSFTTGSDLNSPVYQYIWSMGTSSSDMCGILLVYGKITATSRNTHFSAITDTITLSTNKKYYAKFKVKSGIVTLSISEDDVTYTDYTTSLTTNFSSALDMFIGFEKDTADNPFAGSIDLNAFKIYVDGDLVYQPCLKIPYTLSKTGSKIVNYIYRDRVNDMYNQFGYAPYYTLNDGVNFTIPQGEIYGMLENIVESADDGSGNGYIVYNNGTCIQYGRSGSITTQNGTSKEITLTKSYKNSNFKAFGTINISTDFTGAFALYTVTTASNKFNLVIDGISVSSSHTFTCDWYTIGRI